MLLPAFLVTNDDGVKSPALRALVRELQAIPGANTYVVAPDREWSARGHAITIREPVYADRLDDAEFDCAAWAVSGTPADCVKLGLNELAPESIQMVVSGINLGYNLATDVLYSGTVAAAIEAVLAGKPAMAVSSGRTDGEEGDYRLPARVARTLTSLAAHIPHNPWLLNVNVPDRSAGDIHGVAFTELGGCPYEDRVVVGVDEEGRRCYHLAVDIAPDTEEHGTDLAAVRSGKVSITPLEVLRLTRSDLLEYLLPLATRIERMLQDALREPH